MQIHTLEGISVAVLAETFNSAFGDYFVPIRFDAKLLADKIKAENIVLKFSVGVSVNNKLCGFIFIGINNNSKTAYNAGTGIIPEYRGQKVTEKMYSFLLPELTKIGIETHLLEVICHNEKAIHIYQNLGYSITRKLICYKGRISEPDKSDFDITIIDFPEEEQVISFWNHIPAYQNTTHCIKNAPEKYKTFGISCNGTLTAYLTFDLNTFRVKQFGVHNDYRNKGMGHELFYKLQIQIPGSEIVIINVDENDFITNAFLQKIGLVSFISQYEMIKS